MCNTKHAAEMATLAQDRVDNKRDIERGKAMMRGGEIIYFNELTEGDVILGVGEVSELERKEVGMVHFKASGIIFNQRGEAKITIRKRD